MVSQPRDCLLESLLLDRAGQAPKDGGKLVCLLKVRQREEPHVSPSLDCVPGLYVAKPWRLAREWHGFNNTQAVIRVVPHERSVGGDVEPSGQECGFSEEQDVSALGWMCRLADRLVPFGSEALMLQESHQEKHNQCRGHGDSNFENISQHHARLLEAPRHGQRLVYAINFFFRCSQ